MGKHWMEQLYIKEEYLQDSYKNMNLKAQVGETFMDFISLTGNIATSRHPYISLIDDTDSISENPWFFPAASSVS